MPSSRVRPGSSLTDLLGPAQPFLFLVPQVLACRAELMPRDEALPVAPPPGPAAPHHSPAGASSHFRDKETTGQTHSKHKPSRAGNRQAEAACRAWSLRDTVPGPLSGWQPAGPAGPPACPPWCLGIQLPRQKQPGSVWAGENHPNESQKRNASPPASVCP